MHVAVDAANLTRDRRGIGRYVRAMLTRWLEQRDVVRITLLVPDVLVGQARTRLTRILSRDELAVRRRNAVRSLAPDLVWYPWNGMTWTSPFVNIATVHDVWPFVSPAAAPATRRREQTSYLTMAAQTRAIIANSHFTQMEITRYLPVPESRVHVVHMGVDPAPSAATSVQLHGAERYVLAVGEDEPRKNFATLRRAMTLLPESLRRTTGLVIAGRSRPSPDGGRVALHESRRELTIEFPGAESAPTLVTGEVSDAVLGELYAHAAVFAFPSIYEGFGLVVLEAMAHGTPVVASDAASIPEVAGDAALYFPAGDADALAHTLLQAITDENAAAALAAAGKIRAREFSWDRTARNTLEVFSRVIAGAGA
ncbi:MAG: glycosyltransferase family 4 protein [Candidatus Eremiobacteraeota bacterium]|nr:glycosyltransferase family 4 protein [Candidatus Eremiobacteraeota bacterium]MBV8594862.1 glycosyltransferase family 4 protein [Candidatus Eremiobacteraeota bacterium]